MELISAYLDLGLSSRTKLFLSFLLKIKAWMTPWAWCKCGAKRETHKQGKCPRGRNYDWIAFPPRQRRQQSVNKYFPLPSVLHLFVCHRLRRKFWWANGHEEYSLFKFPPHTASGTSYVVRIMFGHATVSLKPSSLVKPIYGFDSLYHVKPKTCYTRMFSEQPAVD